ncbi:MAG: VCBS repeat-containing protein, partial [Microthrixaceae bacterium]
MNRIKGRSNQTRWDHIFLFFTSIAVLGLFTTACSDQKAVLSDTTTTSTTRVPQGNAEESVVPPAVEDPKSQLTSEQLGGLVFTDVTSAAGLLRDHSTRDLIGEDGMTGAVSVVDINSDGLSDVFLGRIGDVNSLYVNNGDGTFMDVAAQAGLLGPNPEFGTGPTVFFDVDADGDQDAYMAAVGAESDRMYRNNGAGVF